MQSQWSNLTVCKLRLYVAIKGFLPLLHLLRLLRLLRCSIRGVCMALSFRNMRENIVSRYHVVNGLYWNGNFNRYCSQTCLF